VPHGFAIRGDPRKPQIAKARAEALQDAVDYVQSLFGKPALG